MLQYKKGDKKMDVIVFILVGLIGGLGLGYIVFIAARKGQLEKEKSKVSVSYTHLTLPTNREV